MQTDFTEICHNFSKKPWYLRNQSVAHLVLKLYFQFENEELLTVFFRNLFQMKETGLHKFTSSEEKIFVNIIEAMEQNWSEKSG